MRAESLNILADAMTPAENALLLKAVRVETRQRRPLLAVLGVGLSLVLTCAAVRWIWLRLPLGLTAWLVRHDWSVLRVMMVVGAGVHSYIVLFTITARNRQFFLREAKQNTLEQLLITPLPPHALMLRITAHNFYYGMLLSLVGLPLYTFWMLMGDLTGGQLVVMYLLFAHVSFTPPSPQQFVTLWRMRQVSQMTPSQRKQLARQQAAPFAASALLINLGFQFITQVIIRTPAGRKVVGGFVKSVWNTLPAALKGVAPTVAVSWLYFCAVLLTTSLPWFRLHLPPIIFALPLMLVGRVLAILRPAVFIAGNLPLMTAPAGSVPPAPIAASPYVEETQKRIARLDSLYYSLFSLALMGYLWKPLIVDGGLAWLVSLTASDKSHAIAGLTFCVGVSVVMRMIYWLRDRLTAEGEKSPTLPYTHTPILQSSASPLCLFALACVLGGVSPFNRPTCIILGKLLALGVTAAAFCVAARWWQRRVIAARPPRENAEEVITLWTGLIHPQLAAYDQQHGVWFSNAAMQVTWFLFFLVWVYPFIALLSDHPFVQQTAAVSPFLSLASLSPRLNEFLQSITVIKFAPTPPWWMGLLMQSVAALLWGALALRLHPHRYRQVLVGAREGNIGWWARLTARVRALNDRLIERLSDEISARFDNPVAVKEVRVRARRENWAAQQIVIFLVAWLFVLIPACVLLWGVTFAPAPPANFLLTTVLANVCPELGKLSLPAQVFLSIVLPLWAMEWVIAWILTIQPGTAFDGERDSGTMGFLLTTPLSDRDIILGKWMGFTADSWLGFALHLPMDVLLVLIITLSGAPQILPLFIAFTAFLASVLFGGAMLSVALGARSKARGAGAGWSLLVSTLLQILVLVLVIGLASLQPPLIAYTLPFLLGTALHAAVGVLALTYGSRVLHRLRVGDVAFEGQLREN